MKSSFDPGSISANAPRGWSLPQSRFGQFWLRIFNWKLLGEFPNEKKIIVIVAPHTSNWDWIVGVLTIWALRLKFSYLIKASLFFWPLGAVIRGTGGIAVDRGNPEGVTEKLVRTFKETDKLYFAITPEGTRGEVSRWKSGFLRVAYAAEVPVVPVRLDYLRREITIHSPAVLSGDIDKDLTTVRAVYDV